MDEPRAVVISPEPPYPPAGGGAVRTASVLEWLTRRMRVDLVLFAVDQDPEKSLPPGRFADVLTLRLPPHSTHGRARVARNAARLIRGAPPLVDRFGGCEGPLTRFLAKRTYRLGWIEHFWCAPYASVLRPHCRKLALNLHNIESCWHRRLAESEPWPLSWAHRRFSRAYRKLESELLERFDAVLVTSAEDAALVGRDAVVYPNSIPAVAAPPRKPDDSIVFSGNLEYHPNLQAVRWFHRRVWPRLREQWPGLRWRIVGKNPHALPSGVRSDPGVIITGSVENPLTEIAAGKVAVAPVLSGSGTRIKIIEAWAAGTPVVSTRIGAEGLHGVDGVHLLIEDTPAGFAAAVSRLLAGAELAGRIAASGRALYEAGYTWDAAWRNLAPIEALAGLR